jgi:hypothetical protein
MVEEDAIKATMEALQAQLVAVGYPLKVDGKMGQKTYDACRSHQGLGPKLPASLKTIKNAKRDWRLAKSLDILRAQLNANFPKRSKTHDGTIGDEAHATRVSDHNPWVVASDGSPIVTAMDITHDPANGVDCAALAEVIKRDPRVKYVIWNKRIYNKEIAKLWRVYYGSNPHTAHMHVSVVRFEEQYDGTTMWNLM